MRPRPDLEHSLIGVVLDPQPLIDLLLPRPLLSQPSADPARRRFNNDNSLLNSTFCSTAPFHFPYIKYWSLILRSCMRSGLRLFIFLSISLLSDTCSLRSCSSLRLLSWISFTRDFKRSELLWILFGQHKGKVSPLLRYFLLNKTRSGKKIKY